MTELLQRDKSVISRHIKNVLEEGEWLPAATVSKYATVQNEGGLEVVRNIDLYNLDIKHPNAVQEEILETPLVIIAKIEQDLADLTALVGRMKAS